MAATASAQACAVQCCNTDGSMPHPRPHPPIPPGLPPFAPSFYPVCTPQLLSMAPLSSPRMSSRRPSCIFPPFRPACLPRTVPFIRWSTRENKLFCFPLWSTARLRLVLAQRPVDRRPLDGTSPYDPPVQCHHPITTDPTIPAHLAHPAHPRSPRSPPLTCRGSLRPAFVCTAQRAVERGKGQGSVVFPAAACTSSYPCGGGLRY